MTDIIVSVVPLLADAPYKIQVAVDRQWESALKLNFSQLEFDEQQIKGFLRGNPEIVAIELFYKTLDGFDFYIGIQHGNKLKKVATPIEFIYQYILSLKRLQDLSLPSVIRSLGESLNGDPRAFFSEQPASAALGVVDYWMTFGPSEIWKQGEAEVTEQHVRQKLSAHPDLLSNDKNYVGLEVVFNTPTLHWLSFQVSDAYEGKYVLNIPKIYTLMNNYFHL